MSPPKKKGAPNQRRSSNPDQGALQNSTGRRPSRGARAKRCFCSSRATVAQVGRFRGSSDLTLARRSRCLHGRTMAVVFLPGSVLRLLSSGSTFLECAAGCLIVCAGIGRDATTPPMERYVEHNEDECQVCLGSRLALTREAGATAGSGGAGARAWTCVPVHFARILFQPA